jgi:hypothetical protein
VPLPDAENAKLNEMFARTIMYSPKQIVDLKPKEVQSVRFTIRPPRDIENLQDEYLAMITFTSNPDYTSTIENILYEKKVNKMQH